MYHHVAWLNFVNVIATPFSLVTKDIIGSTIEYNFYLCRVPSFDFKKLSFFKNVFITKTMTVPLDNLIKTISLRTQNKK